MEENEKNNKVLRSSVLIKYVGKSGPVDICCGEAVWQVISKQTSERQNQQGCESGLNYMSKAMAGRKFN